MKYEWRGDKVVMIVGDTETEVMPKPGQKTMAPGLGDLVAAAASSVGVKPKEGCGCERRRQALNQATPNFIRRMLDAMRRYWSRWRNKGDFPYAVSADPVTVGQDGKKANEAAD
jgi:hypothetical protein